MKRLVWLTAMAFAAVTALAQPAPRARAGQDFASDTQTVPVMANTTGFGGTTFQTYVAILNPTSSAFSVNVSFYDATGTKRDAQINLAAGELKTYANFLDAVFHTTGGGAVTFTTPDTAGGTRNNRFILTTEIRSGGKYGTSIPALEFAGSNSPSFAGGITVDANTRTNVGCFNQTSAPINVKATVLDNSGAQTLGTVNLVLAGNGWGQTGINTIVSNGYVKFQPDDNAVCYAVVVDNTSQDGRLTTAAEYRP